MLEFLMTVYTGLRAALGVKSAVDGWDKLDTMSVKWEADPKVLSYLESNFADYHLLAEGEITSLTVEVVSYRYDTGKKDEEGNPISDSDIILRYVGGGTSIQSATDLKVLADPAYFDNDTVKADIKTLTGRTGYPTKVLLAETKWDPHGGFAFNEFTEDVDGIVDKAARKSRIVKAMDKAPTLDRRINIMKQAQLDYEASLNASLSLKDKVRVQDLIGAKNAILAGLDAAVKDYEEYRRELAREQAIAVIGMLLKAASLATDIMDKERQTEQWKTLNDKLAGIEKNVAELQGAADRLSNELSAMGRRPTTVIYNINIINEYTTHYGVMPPAPMNFRP